MTERTPLPPGAIERELGGMVERSWQSFGMPVFELRVENLLPFVTGLRERFDFVLFLDVTAVDYPERSPRFDLVYHFYSRRHNQRVRLKLPVPTEPPVAPTLCGLFGSARYMEREVHDMYGIAFAGNADLRPILPAEQRGREHSHANKVFPIFPAADRVPPSQT